MYVWSAFFQGPNLTGLEAPETAMLTTYGYVCINKIKNLWESGKAQLRT